VERIARLDGEIAKTATALGQLQTELAGLYDETGSITERVAAGEGQAASRIDRLQDALAQQLDVVAVGSPIFAVAVGQLRSIALTGAPFEAELITAYTLGGTDPRTAAAIETLVGPSRVGIPSIGELRASLATTAAAAGILFGADLTYYDYGKSLLSSYTGLTVEPYSIEASRDLLRRADLRLSADDVAGARTLLHELNSTVGAAMAPWFAIADERLTAETALSILSAVVIETLGDKVMGKTPTDVLGKTSSHPTAAAAGGG
jgi:uroporphyrinogen-III synthase